MYDQSSTDQQQSELAEAVAAYEAKRAARVDRFRLRASRAGERSQAAYRASHTATEGIPFGQPILVGHHSERRHRNALRRAQRAMSRSCEESKKAEYWEQRAESAESNGSIASDDPAAPDKLRARIADLEAKQERMKAVNKALRSKNRDAALAALGLSPAAIAKAKEPDFCGRIGFPSYATQNNNANIRRLKDRLAILERAAARGPAAEFSGNGVTVSENPLNGRIEIRFDSKPAADLIARLKASFWILRRKDGEWFWMSHRTTEAKALASELSGGAYN